MNCETLQDWADKLKRASAGVQSHSDEAFCEAIATLSQLEHEIYVASLDLKVETQSNRRNH
jgi:hypothetical protein